VNYQQKTGLFDAAQRTLYLRKYEDYLNEHYEGQRFNRELVEFIKENLRFNFPRIDDRGWIVTADPKDVRTIRIQYVGKDDAVRALAEFFARIELNKKLAEEDRIYKEWYNAPTVAIPRLSQVDSE